MLYLWLKAFHVIAVICWFAGLFYLPRLFVYHSMSEDNISRERFCIMERKLYRGIMWPAMVVTCALGLWILLDIQYGWLKAPWMHVKLLLVAVLVTYHFACGHFVRCFARGESRHGHVFFRWFNEAPTILLIAICALVVVKPFS